MQLNILNSSLLKFFQSTVVCNKIPHQNILVQVYQKHLNVCPFLSLKNELYLFFQIFRNLKNLVCLIFFKASFTFLSKYFSVLKISQFICCFLHLHTYLVSTSKFIIMLFSQEFGVVTKFYIKKLHVLFFLLQAVQKVIWLHLKFVVLRY